MDFQTTSTTQALRRALYLGAQDFNIWRPLTLQGFNFNDVFVQHHMDVVESPVHGLSQQGVYVSFWTPKPLKSTSQDTQLYKDIMPYFDRFIHVYG